MTVTDMAKAVGQKVLYGSGGSLSFVCSIQDVKCSYGSVRFLITPLSGAGSKWVDMNSVQPIKQVDPTQPESRQEQRKSIAAAPSYTFDRNTGAVVTTPKFYPATTNNKR